HGVVNKLRYVTGEPVNSRGGQLPVRKNDVESGSQHLNRNRAGSNLAGLDEFRQSLREQGLVVEWSSIEFGTQKLSLVQQGDRLLQSRILLVVVFAAHPLRFGMHVIIAIQESFDIATSGELYFCFCASDRLYWRRAASDCRRRSTSSRWRADAALPVPNTRC